MDEDEARPRSFFDYLEAPLWRPYCVLVPLLVFVLVAGVLARVLPKYYRSTTLILVESEKVPDAFVRQLATESTTSSLQTLKQQVLSRTRLEKVITELDPYPAGDEKTTMSDLVETMRKGIAIGVRGNDAFTIQYVHTDPVTAKNVTARLATMFIEETSASREEQVKGATRFIEVQLDEARQRLEEKEAAVRRFKERNLGHLPEQLNATLSTLQRLQLEKQSLDEGIRAAADRAATLQQNVAAGTIDTGSELKQLRAELATLRVRYTENHPDVRRLVGRIEQLGQSLAESSPTLPTSTVDPSVVSAEHDLEALRARRDELQQRISLLQNRVERAPSVEQELGLLTRDHETLRQNYLSLLAKRMDAETAESLEKRWKGQQFRILDPANLPEREFFPDTRQFLLVALFLGLVLGAGIAVAVEVMDSTVKNSQDLADLVPFPVMATLPHVRGRRLKRRPAKPDTGSGDPSHGSLKPTLVTQTNSVPARPSAPRGRGRKMREAVAVAAAVESPAEEYGAPAFRELPEVIPQPIEPAFIEALTGHSALAEELRVLRSKVKRLADERPLRCLGVVSGAPGEGKTLTALGLANALAQEHARRRVLLVEADLRRRSLLPYLGLPIESGLVDWFEGDGRAPIPIHRLGPRAPFVLSAGTKAPDDPEIFSSPRLQAMFRATLHCFDFVLIDCPPIGPVADPLVLKDVVDGFLMVVRARVGSVGTLSRAVSYLSPEAIGGAVLNDYREILHRHY